MHIYNLKQLQEKSKARYRIEPRLSHFLFFLLLRQDFSYHLKKAMAQEWSFKNNEPFIHEAKIELLLHLRDFTLLILFVNHSGVQLERHWVRSQLEVKQLCFSPLPASEQLCDPGQVI